ncbi:MAG TPA: alpha-ketoglutarate-dependent dioxygenase AlkB [Candidatus Dormibacteraeota bacterium]|nr:alpha-ketoglutarate-dependent dioxygenase AlkB [Candidatus Dormibacteraeota bacterium]
MTSHPASAPDHAHRRRGAPVIAARAATAPLLTWQPSLLDGGDPAVDAGFAGLVRHSLDGDAWVDHVSGWLRGSERLFVALLEHADWQAVDVLMYGRVVSQPRLVARWAIDGDGPAPPPMLEEIRSALCVGYRRPFNSIAANLYRDGRDSVAWHGDRIPESVVDPVVATVSLGSARRFLMRPKGGAVGLRLDLGAGDLVVMGGTSQRTWEHAVPKTAATGPRISIALRHSE